MSTVRDREILIFHWTYMDYGFAIYKKNVPVIIKG